MAMRRDLLLASGLVGLICALLLGATWALLAAPPVPRDLLPADAALLQVQAQGGGRQLVTARLAPRQGLQTLFKHLTARGWRMRRVNALPDEPVQTYFRRSMAGYLLEVATVTRWGQGRGGVRIAYTRCVRHLTCSWR
jgi:hypothetical protein